MLSIVKRKSVYYIRLRVPVDLRKHFPCNEIVRSLKVGLYGQAKNLARVKIGAIESVFTLLRSNVLTVDMIGAVVAGLFNDREVELMPSKQAISKQAIEVWLQKNPGKDWLVYGTGLFGAALSAMEGMNSCSVESIQRLLDTGYEPDENGDFDTTKPPQICMVQNRQVDNGITITAISKKKGDTLKQVLERFIESKRNSKKDIGARTLLKYNELSIKILECLLFETSKKDVLLSDIDNDLTEKLILRLQRYPLYRNSKYKGKSLAEIYKLDEVRFPAPNTGNQMVSSLSSVFEYALDKCEGLKRNYAAKVDDLLEPVGKESDARDIFRPADIEEIVMELIKRKSKGEFLNSPHLPFIVMIGLLQGLRVNEICQLSIDDIVEVDGLWCFNISEALPNQSLKNNNSNRVNPIHPALIELGLLQFWKSQKGRGYKRLWEYAGDTLSRTEKSRQGVKGKISCAYYIHSEDHGHYVSKWFNGTFKNKLVLSNPEKQTFHSTRHTFCNWFRQNMNIYEVGEAVTALMGHLDKEDIAVVKQQGFNPDSESFKTYAGKGLDVKRQYETLRLLDYKIDLSGLVYV